VVTLDREEFPGHVGLFAADAKNRSATFGIALGPPFWNQGLGTDVTRLAPHPIPLMLREAVESGPWQPHNDGPAEHQRTG